MIYQIMKMSLCVSFLHKGKMTGKQQYFLKDLVSIECVPCIFKNIVKWPMSHGEEGWCY